jgi:TolB-like protein
MLHATSIARRWAGSLATAAVIAVPTIAGAQNNRPVVVVFDFTNSALGAARQEFDHISTAVQDLMITDLAGNSRIRLVDRTRIKEVLDEQNMVKSGQVDPATAVRLGRIMGAQYAITGGWVSDASGKATLTARTIDIETTQIGNAEKVEGKTADVLAMISSLSGKLSKNLNDLPPRPARVGDAGDAPKAAPAQPGAHDMHSMHAAATMDPTLDYYAKPLSTPVKVKPDGATLKLYNSALAEIDKKNPVKAKELLRQVLEQCKDWEPAQRQLAKLS